MPDRIPLSGMRGRSVEGPDFVYVDRGYITPCRVWQHAKRHERGYGVRRRGAKLVYVHRDEWERAYGPIPAGMRVCHHCDQTDCAELSHLFLGTDLDNVRDMAAKGRRSPVGARGELNGHAKLTAEIVAAIRSSSEEGVALAARYGVTQSTVSKVRCGRTWREAA